MRNAGRKSCCALGLFDDTTYTVSTCPLAEQDLVVLFTDGVFDVEGENDLLNTDWLAEQVRTRSQQPAAQIFDQVLEQLQKFSHEGHFADDVCLVGMELRTS
jgi:sigma-B regulation protein RsbU (phosphoserine phosphatase)